MQAADRGADERWMRHALALASGSARAVRPNPLVGCVLVRAGEVAGEGRTAPPPGPHAEVVALRAAGDDARGATAYVTLEPCAHTGRTPPCTEALLSAGVARVVVAARDPHPLAAGGAERLREQGVEVTTGIAEDAARHQLRVFLHEVAHCRPFVTLKAAVSLDGRIAAADGSSQWLTGPAARARAHALRAEVDAILVGSGTALADDPRLTVRLGDATEAGAEPPPLRVLLDGRGRVTGGHLLDGTAPTLVVTAAGPEHPAAGRTNVDVVTVARNGGGRLDLPSALALLHDRGVRHLLVEGGAAVAGDLARRGLVDELVIHLAPLLLGGGGRPLVEGDGIATLAGAFRFVPTAVGRADDDTLLTLAPAARTPPGATTCSPAS